jgi:3-methyladenine DNA glycosylase Tag
VRHGHEQVSKEWERRGADVVCPTIAQSGQQAAGIVDDHATDRFRRDARRAARRAAQPGRA